MKKFAFSLVTLVIFAAGCTECNEPSPDCIDPRKVNRHAVCTDELAPVCGCDGVTYDNACRAENAGVRSYTQGPCGSL